MGETPSEIDSDHKPEVESEVESEVNHELQQEDINKSNTENRDEPNHNSDDDLPDGTDTDNSDGEEEASLKEEAQPARQYPLKNKRPPGKYWLASHSRDHASLSSIVCPSV